MTGVWVRRWGSGLVIGAALAVPLGIALPSPASAAPAAVTVLARPAASPVAPDVGAFRVDIRADLADYLARYGGRLSGAERQRMTALSGQVDRSLALLTLRVATAEQRIASGAPSARATAASAVAQYERAHAQALATLDEVQPILQPKLSLFEALEAKMDFDEQMSRFESLGDRIQALPGLARR